MHLLKNKKPNKIAIFGLVYDSGSQIFYDDSFYIWSINTAYRIFPRLDLLWDMHDWDSSEYEAYYSKELLEEKHPFAIVKPYAVNSVNTIIKYPWQKISEEIPYYNACSITYMLAYALVEYDLPIYVFGLNNVEMTTHPNMLQCFYYILGWARAKHRPIYLITERTLDDGLFNYGIGMKLKDADIESKFTEKYRIK